MIQKIMFFALRFKPYIELCLFIAYQKCFNPRCIATKNECHGHSFRRRFFS